MKTRTSDRSVKRRVAAMVGATVSLAVFVWLAATHEVVLIGAVCRVVDRLCPGSSFPEVTLKRVAESNAKAGELRNALDAYRQILGLHASAMNAEAQFRVAEYTEMVAAHSPSRDGQTPLAKAVPFYKVVTEKYPDSPFVGPAFHRIVDYHIENRDYVAADRLMKQIDQDYPGGTFYDQHLAKWIVVAYRMGDTEKTRQKCEELLSFFPESVYTTVATRTMEWLGKHQLDKNAEHPTSNVEGYRSRRGGTDHGPRR